MKVVGIVTEYNPFHNGHKYQIEKIRKETNADYSIPELPKEIREQLEGIASSFSLLERISFCGFKFSFSDKCDNYYRLLRFFHTLSRFFRRPNVLLKM